MDSDFDVSNVRDALSAFSRFVHKNYKKVFDGVFKTLETGLSKLGDSSGAQTKAIRELLELIKDIPMDGKQDYDVLGFVYEYLISMFADNAGKKAGEFYIGTSSEKSNDNQMIFFDLFNKVEILKESIIVDLWWKHISSNTYKKKIGSYCYGYTKYHYSKLCDLGYRVLNNLGL